MKKKSNNQKKHKIILVKKICFSLMVVAIYLFGQAVFLPSINLSDDWKSILGEVEALNQLASMTGANFNSLTLFSLGLGPYMSAMIIQRFLTIFKVMENATVMQKHYFQMFVTVIVATLQAFAMTSNVTYRDLELPFLVNPIIMRVLAILFLITGMLILIWLGSMNVQYGIGGMIIIVLTNMLGSFAKNLINFLFDSNFSQNKILLTGIGLFVFIIIFIYIVITIYNAEYRIPIKRIAINSSYSKESYLPIRLTPAGGMPFMYAMTLMIFPPIIIGFLLNFYPTNYHLLFLSRNLSLTKLPGLIMYILILYILALGFAYFNYDAYDIARNMRNNGDYIEGIEPGKSTQVYINAKVRSLAHIGALYIVMIGGLPLLLALGNTDATSIAMLVSNVFVITTLMLTVVEQIQGIQMWKKYKDIL